MTSIVCAHTIVVMTFGDRLASARLAKGIASARELDRLAHIAEGYTSLLESGYRKMPGARIALRLAEALGVSVEWLVNGDGDEPSAEEEPAA